MKSDYSNKSIDQKKYIEYPSVSKFFESGSFSTEKKQKIVYFQPKSFENLKQFSEYIENSLTCQEVRKFIKKNYLEQLSELNELFEIDIDQFIDLLIQEQKDVICMDVDDIELLQNLKQNLKQTLQQDQTDKLSIEKLEILTKSTGILGLFMSFIKDNDDSQNNQQNFEKYLLNYRNDITDFIKKQYEIKENQINELFDKREKQIQTMLEKLKTYNDFEQILRDKNKQIEDLKLQVEFQKVQISPIPEKKIMRQCQTTRNILSKQFAFQNAQSSAVFSPYLTPKKNNTKENETEQEIDYTNKLLQVIQICQNEIKSNNLGLKDLMKLFQKLMIMIPNLGGDFECKNSFLSILVNISFTLYEKIKNNKNEQIEFKEIYQSKFWQHYKNTQMKKNIHIIEEFRLLMHKVINILQFLRNKQQIDERKFIINNQIQFLNICYSDNQDEILLNFKQINQQLNSKDYKNLVSFYILQNNGINQIISYLRSIDISHNFEIFEQALIIIFNFSQDQDFITQLNSVKNMDFFIDLIYLFQDQFKFTNIVVNILKNITEFIKLKGNLQTKFLMRIQKYRQYLKQKNIYHQIQQDLNTLYTNIQN